MNNAEKFKEVFGIELPAIVTCTRDLDESCKQCVDVTHCIKWITAEYKEVEE